MSGNAGNAEISAAKCAARGRDWQVNEIMQGISPPDESAGVAEWQTSSVPIAAVAP